MTEQTNQVYLVLENGAAFAGSPIGDWSSQTIGSPSATEKSGTGPENVIRSVGELVFTTGMTGYLETLTDPSYAGQIILQTFPMIGNYGVISSDFEGKCFARGYVVRELCNMPSNFRSEGKLDAWLKAAGIPGICGVDTRELTRIIRENGVMNACLCTGVPDDLSEVRSYRVHDVLREVSTGENMVFDSENGESPESAAGKRPAVVLVDYGAKRNIVRCLVKRGCRVTVVPHDTPAEEILAMQPDGVMLSNGPGDPAENEYEISQIAKLVGQVPVFGICLGHQLCALAMGGRTYKLKYGHRGANQPVTDGKRTWITTQNHGYAVENASMAGIAELSFYNANDRSCEGLEYPGRRCFTVQFHPEACAGPHDTEFLFDRFLRMMRGEEA